MSARKGASADPRSPAAQAWRHWYWTARWRRIAKAQLDEHPLCAMCEGRGIVTAATICDHVEPHKGNVVKFWDIGNLQSLCAACHNSDKQSLEKGGNGRSVIGLDGWPLS